MNTDVLLSLQRQPEERVHRDELLFQIVHQATELWLMLACTEVGEAARRVRAGDIEAALPLLTRAELAVRLITDELDMLRHLSPWDFQMIRTVLGNGSGFESPGWRQVRQVSGTLESAFRDALRDRNQTLAEVYRGSPTQPLYLLAEALTTWDDRVTSWRIRHYRTVLRTIGDGVVGTQGTPVRALARLIDHRFFPDLWRVRTELTRTGPMAEREVWQP
ncbi:tryptophan 2,3-dioxygenase [Phytohabitans rumicis]|uniref:Tryptophan 2,3-dioxygenase n=1 Tax=Phytohabitans rumicis TaxID=1076125 RepID=A0A6V8LBX3_9ACTN|nr:tryptophan 2,3-dioxygenase [Phytohabitans rumicis]